MGLGLLPYDQAGRVRIARTETVKKGRGVAPLRQTPGPSAMVVA